MKNLSAKVRAWLVHLVLSLVVLLPVVLLVTLWWFPRPFFQVLDTAHILAILVGVHLVLGPMLTFIVYVPNKKGMKFDLWVIALLQLAALTYGTFAIYSERPAYVVFAVDRYEALAAKDVAFERVGMTGFGEALPGEPVYAFAQMPMGQAYQTFLDGVMFRGQPDLERRPEFWLPLETGKDAILATARPLGVLMEQRPDAAQDLARMAERHDLNPATALFLPLPGKRDDYAALIDPVTAKVMDAIAIDPWIDR